MLYVSFIWTAFRSLRRVNPVTDILPLNWVQCLRYEVCSSSNNASKLIILVKWKKKPNFFHWWPVGVKKFITIIASNSLYFQWLSCFSCGCKFRLLSCCFWIDCNMHKHYFNQSVLIYLNYCLQQLC